jgi:hypothetical protein
MSRVSDTGGLRMAGPDHAIPRRHGDLGGDRCPHHGEPGTPADGVRLVERFSHVHPPVFSRGLQHALPHLENLLTGQ